MHYKVHWRGGRRLGLCRLIAVQPLIGLTVDISSAGIGGSVLSTLTQFVSNRSLPHLVVDGCQSKQVTVLSGVPQGSVFGI